MILFINVQTIIKENSGPDDVWFPLGRYASLG